MSGLIDKEVLAGFIEEVKTYLPAIGNGIVAYQANPAQVDELEEALRHAHTIKGAAAMVGLAGLSHIAYHLEESLEAISASQLDISDEVTAWVAQTVAQIERYLDDALNDTLNEELLLAEVLRDYRRIRGMPVDEDMLADDSFLENLDSKTLFSEEIDPELLEGFFLEAEDHLRLINLSLVELGKNPARRDMLQEIRRSVHTLKGAAGTIGLQVIAGLSHRMEDLLDRLYDGQMAIDDEVMALLLASGDTLDEIVRDNPAPEMAQAALQELYAAYDILLPATPDTRQLEPVDEGSAIELATRARPFYEDNEAETTLEIEQRARPEASDVVRVPIERLDELIRLVSELVITRTAFEQRLGDLAREIDELRPSIDRLRRISTKLEVDYEVSALGGGVHGLVLTSQPEPLAKQNGGLATPDYLIQPSTRQTHGFDELEFDRYTEFHLLSRELAETTGDVNSVGNALNTLIGDFDGVLNRQARLSSELQEKLMRTRMVPLATLATRLHRTVRVVAQRRHKLAELVLTGEQTELDKTVLEEMADPLLHLLRNAVDHGLESPAARRALSKPERGLIKLDAYQEGNQVVIRVSDDGAGLNLAAIRAKAVSNGYISEAEAVTLSEQDLRVLIFLPGFSTAAEISEVSGRGVGLDVVKAKANNLKGTVTLDSTPGIGTTFTIRLPLTLAVMRALLVRANNEIFALPLNAIHQIFRLDGNEFEKVGQEPVVRVAGKIYPVVRLSDLLRLKQPADETVTRPPVLIVVAGGQEIALVVDHIMQGREIVIKTLGNHLRYIHGIMGATLMGDGRIVLILNPAELVAAPAQRQTRISLPPRPASLPVRAPSENWSVMVVDDSISVRRVVSNLIKSAGWQPMMAKDGVEALELIQRAARLPDLILLDVEMPRMDGYELTSTLKGQAAYRDIPIVMLTSRAGDKHRHKALDLGVSEYVVKPYRDEILLTIIRQLVSQARGVVAA